jgi:hypothetical protein
VDVVGHEQKQFEIPFFGSVVMLGRLEQQSHNVWLTELFHPTPLAANRG